MSQHPPGTRQERRAARRRQEILEAAAKVFAEKGFHRATTREIAEAADIAEGTIYNYFESKDELLMAIIDQLSNLQYRRETYAGTLNLDARQAFHNIMLERLKSVREQNVFLCAVLPEILSTPHLRELYRERVLLPGSRDLERHFQMRIEHGEIQEVDPVIAIRVLGAMGLGLEVLMILGDEDAQALWNDTEQLADLLMRVTFEGVLPLTHADRTPPPDEAK